jgi:hypothetical protein
MLVEKSGEKDLRRERRVRGEEDGPAEDGSFRELGWWSWVVSGGNDERLAYKVKSMLC